MGLLNRGIAPARTLTRARILLAADGHKTDAAIAEALHVHPATVERTRRRFVEGRAARALHEKPRPGGRPKLDPKQEAFLVALACSDAPSGRGHWTMQLLAGRLVELAVVESISDETVRRALKKRPEAVGAQALVHRVCRGGLCLAHGGRAGSVCRALCGGSASHVL